MSAPAVAEKSCPPRIFSGTHFTVEEIVVARAMLPHQALSRAVGELRLAFDSRNPVEIKLACERVKSSATEMKTTAEKIEALSGSLVQTFVSHMARRPRV